MNKPLVLVVEDDRPIRNLIVTTLKAHDYHYLTAENGHSAIIEATSHNPDIVLLDLGAAGYRRHTGDRKHPLMVKYAHYRDQCAQRG